LDVFLVGVRCDLGEIDHRERGRRDRRIGEGRTHVVVDRIHTFGPCDLDVDTTSGITPALTRRVLDAWHARGPVRPLEIGRPAGGGVGLPGSAG
jgi:chloramphenicol 3-O phosphotransferase